MSCPNRVRSPTVRGSNAAATIACVPHSANPTSRTWGNGPAPASFAALGEHRGIVGGVGHVEHHPVHGHHPHAEERQPANHSPQDLLIGLSVEQA
jgi:hypothetical protein